GAASAAEALHQIADEVQDNTLAGAAFGPRPQLRLHGDEDLADHHLRRGVEHARAHRSERPPYLYPSPVAKARPAPLPGKLEMAGTLEEALLALSRDGEIHGLRRHEVDKLHPARIVAADASDADLHLSRIFMAPHYGETATAGQAAREPPGIHEERPERLAIRHEVIIPLDRDTLSQATTRLRSRGNRFRKRSSLDHLKDPFRRQRQAIGRDA